MPSCISWLKHFIWLALTVWPLATVGADYAAQIRYADLSRNDKKIEINASIDYLLSPTAKEALLKGVALEWRLILEIRKRGRLWDETVIELKQPYKLQFHALLNQFAVQIGQQRVEMFLTLNAALDYMSQLHLESDRELPSDGADYQLALKTQFRREALPVPLRPFAYLDPQWYLSSHWFLWPIPK